MESNERAVKVRRTIVGVVGGVLGMAAGIWAARRAAEAVYGWPPEVLDTLGARAIQGGVLSVAFLVPFGAAVMLVALVVALPATVREGWSLDRWLGLAELRPARRPPTPGEWRA